jgi:predicted TIM-barrel fold metal-dependent hydrolase
MEFYVELLIALKSMSEIENVYFETSCSILYGILELIKIFGADRVLFGSDSPTATPFELEYNKISSLRIPKEDKSKILGGNIKRLLNIEL